MNIPSELDDKDWNEIFTAASREPSRTTATTRATYKQVLALVNLTHSVFNAQKHVSQRLETLNERLAEATSSSNRLASKTFWLTVFLVTATIVQAIAAVIVASK